MKLIFHAHIARDLVAELVENAVAIALSGAAILLLLLAAAISAHACMWDAKDEKLYCNFGEPMPPNAIPCGPTMEPRRNVQGTVYCGHVEEKQTIPVSNFVGFTPKVGTLNLDCELVESSSGVTPVKVKMRCKAIEGDSSPSVGQGTR